MGVPSPGEYEPAVADGPYRSRLERGLSKKGYRAVWDRTDHVHELGLTTLELRVLDDRFVPLRAHAVTFRRDHRCEGAVAERICEDMVEGDRRYGEPIRYGG